jgi:hypothetical protein
MVFSPTGGLHALKCYMYINNIKVSSVFVDFPLRLYRLTRRNALTGGSHPGQSVDRRTLDSQVNRMPI